MPRFAANISMLFTELPFLERFEAAREAGFKGVEFLFPYDFPVDEISDARKQSGLTQVLFNLPAGDWKRGDRGIGALPGREAEFERGFHQALTYANALSCKKLHVMSGIAPTTLDDRVNLSALEGNLRRIAQRLAHCSALPRAAPGIETCFFGIGINNPVDTIKWLNHCFVPLVFDQ